MMALGRWWAMTKINFRCTVPNIISEDDVKENVIYIREDADIYNKNKDDRPYDFIENTDIYKKSGIKLIVSIPLDL